MVCTYGMVRRTSYRQVFVESRLAVGLDRLAQDLAGVAFVAAEDEVKSRVSVTREEMQHGAFAYRRHLHKRRRFREVRAAEACVRVFELHVVDAAMADGYVAALSPEGDPYGTEMGHTEAAYIIAPSFRVFDVLLDAAAPIDDGVGSTGTDQSGDARFAVARSNLLRAQVEANLPVLPQWHSAIS